jgi:hypothetical protein
MMNHSHFLDTCVSGFNPQYTRRAHAAGLEVKIIFKLPKVGMTTVRLFGSVFQITEFLRCEGKTEHNVQMLVSAIKTVTAEAASPTAVKNLWLKENRA